MSASKAALKAINASIQCKKYDDAIEKARELLSSDGNSYQANIFLGFALDKEAKEADAEAAYIAATRIKAADPQAWQGLIKVYEKQGSKKIAAYQAAALKIADLFKSLDDKHRCQDVIDKFQDFVKTQGTRSQQKQALELLLPTGPLYDYLEGRVPHPAQTYQLIAQISEFEEKERINKEIGERRTRLGSKIGQVTLDVKREVFQVSNLEELYANIINWSNDDEIRRQYEERLLRRCIETLEALPLGRDKLEKRRKVFTLASDMVIIKHPYKLAWDIALEWQDLKMIEEFDANTLRKYIELFKNSGLAQVLKGYMSSELSPFPTFTRPLGPQQDQPTLDESEDDEDGGVSLLDHMTAEERLLLMSEGVVDCPQSVLAHRLLGEYYQHLDEHGSTVELMRNGIRLLEDERLRVGVDFPNASIDLTGLLGTALVFYQSPKNHIEAKALFDDLLMQDPMSAPALIGSGLIYEEEEDYPAAFDALGRALSKNPKNLRVRVEYYWVKAVNSNYIEGIDELKACLPLITNKDLRGKSLLALTQYRIGLCLWNLDTSQQARGDRHGAYAYFLAALKSDLSFAPAYSTLGTFYADYVKDRKRARKCFQKAFELSSSEVHSAERLAREFAAQRDWESVEAVAQRVIESGKVRPAPGSKKKGISWPFAALGISELNRQDYPKSVVSFQAALRITPSDYHSWVGLGESYHNLGRYIAASKAFKHAEQFDDEIQQKQLGEIWFAKHMLGNVKQELGDYDEAIREYRSVLKERPSEFGAALALIQALVEDAWESRTKGFFGKATNSAHEAIGVASIVVESHPDSFNLWRAVGDACAIFSCIPGRADDFSSGLIFKILHQAHLGNALALFSDVDSVDAEALLKINLQDQTSMASCLHSAILCHKRAIATSVNDQYAQAVAYYNLGWAEYRAHICLAADLKHRRLRYVKTAIRCFKRAIELEARNPEFWNSLGVVTTDLNPKVAQHSFIRSLYINERNAQVWTNLGVLYLSQNDLQLATEAFTRAQSADPDFTHSWIGHGFIALFKEDDNEAYNLFTHAMQMSETSSALTKGQYARAMFDRTLSASTITATTDLILPIFALQQFRSMQSEDLSCQHLLSLLYEWIGEHSHATKELLSLCAKLDSDYELTQSPTSLSRFVLCKIDLARSHFASQQFEEAIEAGDTALHLSADDVGNDLSSEARKKCRLSAHLTIGLSHFYQGNIRAALEYLHLALKESNNQPHVACLLAQVLWAQGGESSRSKAHEILYSCIEENPGYVQAVLLLGIIAMLDNDAESLEAVSSELEALRTSETITQIAQDEVNEVLRAIAFTSSGVFDQDVLTELQTSVFLQPHCPGNWTHLADASEDEEGAQFAAEMALMTARKIVPPRGELHAEALAGMFAETRTATNAQIAVILAPWRKQGWKTIHDLV